MIEPHVEGTSISDTLASLYSELEAQNAEGRMTILSCLKALHKDVYAGIAGGDDFQKLQHLVKYGKDSQKETQRILAKKISDLVVDSPVFSEVEKEERTVFLRTSSQSISHLFTWAGELARRIGNFFQYGYRASQNTQRTLAQAATEAIAEAMDQQKRGEEFIDTFTSTYVAKASDTPGAQKFLNAFLRTIRPETQIFEEEAPRAAPARSYAPDTPVELETASLPPEPQVELETASLPPEPQTEKTFPSSEEASHAAINQIVSATKKRTPPSLVPQDYRDRSPEKLAEEEAQRKVDEDFPRDPKGQAKTIYLKLKNRKGTSYSRFSREVASLTDAELKYLVRYTLVALRFPITRDFATAKTILEEYNRTVIKALRGDDYPSFARKELVELLSQCYVETEEDQQKLFELLRTIGAF